MSQSNASRLAHEAMRGMRSDAHRFIRPDWRRFVRPGCDGEPPFDFYECFECKYSPDQPRVSAGNSDGGQWTSEGGGTGSGPRSSSKVPAAGGGEQDKPRRIWVAGTVISICTAGVRVLYGDGTHKVVYDCPNGTTVTRTGAGHRFPGIILQR